MKISKQQFKAALDRAYEAGITYTVQQQYNLDYNTQESVVKRIFKHEVKHAKMRKLKNVREHWNVAADHVVNLDLEKEQDDEG